MSLLQIPSTSSTSNRIFLGNLGYALDEETVRRYCEEWGDLKECRLMCETNTNERKTRGFAFICYVNLNSATKFLGACPHYIGDRRIDVKNTLFEKNDQSKFGDSLLPTKLLFVSFSGTQLNANKFFLDEYFAKFGLINELTIHIFKKTKNFLEKFHVGFAIVQFMKTSSVLKCLQEDKHSIKNFSNIDIRRLVSNEGIVKRKRGLAMETLAKEASQADLSPAKRSSLLSLLDTSSLKQNCVSKKNVAKEYVSAPIKFTSLAGYGYQN